MASSTIGNEISRATIQEATQWARKYFYHVCVAFGLVSLGSVAEAGHDVWFFGLERQVYERQNLIHALLSFLVLVELEYWMNGQASSTSI
jgi:hypothetical protein